MSNPVESSQENSSVVVASSIKKTSLVLLTGILGIVVFINTSLIQQASLLGLEDVEISMIISGINVYSFWLLIVSVLFFIAIIPYEEVICSIKTIFHLSSKSKPLRSAEIIRLLSFIFGTLFFAIIFIMYMIKFSMIFL